MYAYICDPQLNNYKYKRLLAQIESRTIDLGIKGKFIQLQQLGNLLQTVKELVRKDTENLVIIGGDKIVNEIINTLIKNNLDAKVAIGIIPVNQATRLAPILGLPPDKLACDILAKRLVKNINVGIINDQFFLTSAFVPKTNNYLVTIDNQYSIHLQNQSCRIINLDFVDDNKISNAIDSQLEIVIEGEYKENKKLLSWFKKVPDYSHLVAQTVKLEALTSSPEKIIVDEKILLEPPAIVTTHKKTLKFIVGKERLIR